MIWELATLALSAASDSEEGRRKHPVVRLVLVSGLGFDIALQDGTTIGIINVYGGKKRKYIQEIEIMATFQGKGYGFATMCAIFERFPHLEVLEGYSLFDAEPFWESIGCQWLEEHDERSEESTEPRSFELWRDRLISRK